MDQSRKYPAAELEDSAKSKIARLYIIRKAKGTSRKDFTAEMGLAGFHFSERQLDRWVALINSGMEAISLDKLTGPPVALTRPQRDILSGWVLDQIDHGIPVHLDTHSAFASAQFSTHITERTSSNYLEEDGFTYRVIQKKASTFVVDGERLKSDLWKWVSKNQIYLNNIPPSKLCSIDFTFTGHRTERRAGFGVKGGAQPMESLQISKYTNCIITALWADGKNRTPPVCFTYNQNFRRDRSSTARRDAQVEHLRDRLAHHGIDKARIIYIGKEKGEKETFAKESPALLRLFFELYRLPADAVALSDNGNSFFENSLSVLKAIGFKDHLFYPANVHQYLSMNDNRLHGTSKGSWRSERIDYSDDVDSCLTLLKYLDRDIIKYSKYWFKRNVLELKEEAVGELIGTRGSKKSHLHKEWLRAYRIFVGQDARGDMPGVPEELRDRLDGLYWEEKK